VLQQRSSAARESFPWWAPDEPGGLDVNEVSILKVTTHPVVCLGNMRVEEAALRDFGVKGAVRAVGAGAGAGAGAAPSGVNAFERIEELLVRRCRLYPVDACVESAGCSVAAHETKRTTYYGTTELFLLFFVLSGSSRNGGFFDLLKTYAKCVDYDTKTPLVRRNVEAEPTLINGVSYPVESFEWTMSVCQTGFFGANCADPTKLQMYAKTCARVPASFSVTPQQLSHVVTSPVTENLVSKTFLSGVDSTRSNCDVGHERVAVTMTLVILAKEYSIFTQDVHDVLKPIGIFDGAQKDIYINNKTSITTVDAFLASSPMNEGVYKLKNVDVTVGGTSLYYEKLVVLTKCYNTGLDTATGMRAFPTVFADAIEDGNGRERL
jgi:hypothetical protein